MGVVGPLAGSASSVRVPFFWSHGHALLGSAWLFPMAFSQSRFPGAIRAELNRRVMGSAAKFSLALAHTRIFARRYLPCSHRVSADRWNCARRLGVERGRVENHGSAIGFDHNPWLDRQRPIS